MRSVHFHLSNMNWTLYLGRLAASYGSTIGFEGCPFSVGLNKLSWPPQIILAIIESS